MRNTSQQSRFNLCFYANASVKDSANRTQSSLLELLRCSLCSQLVCKITTCSSQKDKKIHVFSTQIDNTCYDVFRRVTTCFDVLRRVMTCQSLNYKMFSSSFSSCIYISSLLYLVRLGLIKSLYAPLSIRSLNSGNALIKAL